MHLFYLQSEIKLPNLFDSLFKFIYICHNHNDIYVLICQPFFLLILLWTLHFRVIQHTADNPQYIDCAQLQIIAYTHYDKTYHSSVQREHSPDKHL